MNELCFVLLLVDVEEKKMRMRHKEMRSEEMHLEKMRHERRMRSDSCSFQRSFHKR